MKILIDECLPRKIKQLLSPHEAHTVQDMGWSGTSNGNLLRLAINAEFTVFITSDKNLRYQNSLPNYKIAFIVLDIIQNTMEYIEPLHTQILSTIRIVEDFKIYTISRV